MEPLDDISMPSALQMVSRFVPKAVGDKVYNPQRWLVSWTLSHRRGMTVLGCGSGQDGDVGQNDGHRGHGDRAENPEIEPCKQAQPVFDKSAKQCSEGRIAFSTMVLA